MLEGYLAWNTGYSMILEHTVVTLNLPSSFFLWISVEAEQEEEHFHGSEFRGCQAGIGNYYDHL